MIRTRKVRIGPTTYRIERVSATTLGEYAGRIYYPKALIELADDMAEHPEVETLVHEITHGIMYHTRPLRLTEEEEEHLVTVLSPAFTQVLRDNPKLIAEITDILRAA